ncbi:Helix-turn-helix domain-containing protein [Paenimyroides ummariense]|uniref:Helix-turn-helix domain-containing protein n=1 Tax=Paenimyroides ummariense TaxID=913024 RepID=A0A1I5E2M7_9FLAO|nr:helix-turn-helix domain-containing protein [Paenimyroides ummariense]SFO05421.1 Helix-turn-helix domain-containing protein [Paenimyroides ummariense]
MNAPTYYAIIPANVRYCKGLKANAKLLYGEITALCNKDGFCWAENSYFAELYEVSEETISRWISDLKKHKFIFISVENQGRFIRKISLDEKIKALDEIVKHPLTKSSTPLDEIVKHNNTYNNTINNKANALDFLSKNYPSEYESLLMKYQSKISDFEKAKESFNLTFDLENRNYDAKTINARAQLYFNNWFTNQSKFRPDVAIVASNPANKRFQI